MKFDWLEFCKQHGVEYAERGGKVSAGNINITCPFCDDRGQHMGLSLSTSSWGCWRCKEGGHSPVRLLCAVLGCSKGRAVELVAAANAPSPDDFERLLDQPQDQGESHRHAPIVLPPGCKPLSPATASTARFRQYLELDRGFGTDVEAVVQQYHLHYATQGEQAWRVVLPVIADGGLVGWTGRSVYKDASLRYKADPFGGTKEHLANFDVLQSVQGVEVLAVVEGPMDFLKLDFYGQRYKVRATCTFGTSWRMGQFQRLVQLARRFPHTVVIYDREEFMMGAFLAEELNSFMPNPVTAHRLTYAKDPGGMSPGAIRLLCTQLKQGALHHV